MTGPLEDDDGNAYKLPYPEKAVNRRHRDLARSLSCPPPELVRQGPFFLYKSQSNACNLTSSFIKIH